MFTIGVSLGVKVIVGVCVLVGVGDRDGVKVGVGTARVYGLETELPIEPFCTGDADMVIVLLPAVESLVTLFKMITTLPPFATAVGTTKTKEGPDWVTMLLIGRPLNVGDVTGVTLVAPGNDMVICVEVVRSQPFRLGTAVETV